MKYRLGDFKKTVTNNVVSGSCGSGDPVLWELRGERVKPPHITSLDGNRENTTPTTNLLCCPDYMA